MQFLQLPMYITLCNDPVWSVRKSCAEVIVSFACCVSLEHRRTILSKILADFLTDDSKWVKVSAFQILGPFISTFAKQFTGVAYNQYGELVLTDQHGTELRYNVYVCAWIFSFNVFFFLSAPKPFTLTHYDGIFWRLFKIVALTVFFLPLRLCLCITEVAK